MVKICYVLLSKGELLKEPNLWINYWKPFFLFFYGKKIGKKLWFYTKKENTFCEYVSLGTIKVSYINFS